MYACTCRLCIICTYRMCGMHGFIMMTSTEMTPSYIRYVTVPTMNRTLDSFDFSSLVWGLGVFRSNPHDRMKCM